MPSRETKSKSSSTATGGLLHTKLMPPRLPSAVIPRERLLARLDEGLTKKVSLVTAPTGFGKTTLVRTWIEGRQVPSAWVTLDEGDNDATRFWTYVCSALRTVDASLGKASLSMLASPQPPSFEALLTPLINDLAGLEEATVLILEDYHVIQSGEVQQGVSFFVQHLPTTLHLIFITRTEPDLPLGLLRARSELVEIQASDLRFDREQAEAFLRTSVQTPLPPLAIDRLLQKTEGWPAGLRLVGLALQNKSAAEIETFAESFSGSDRFIADYLIAEVFESQPPAVQSFLLKTSFLKRLTGSLCDAVLETENNAARLQQLERQHLFLIQLEQMATQPWYRYTPLFAEALQQLAGQRLGEESIKTVFEKASDWYEYHGQLDEAIETALTARSFERAMILIERFMEINDLSALRTLSHWLEHIPQQEILHNPLICFTYAQVILYSTDRFAPATAARIEPFLRAAERAWRKDGNNPRLGQLLSFRGNVVWWQGDFQEAFEYSRQALEELPEHDVFWRGNSLLNVGYEALSAGRILEAQDTVLEARALLGAAQNLFGVLAALQFLAEIFYWQGELEQAEQLNQQIQAEAIGTESMLDDQGIAALNLAHIAYERNELDQAEQLAARALGFGEGRLNEMLQVQASIRLACIHSARGDPARGRELLKSLEARIQNPALLREIQHAQALLSIRGNDVSSLEWWVKIISDPNQEGLPLQKEREAFTLARLRIAHSNGEEALSVLKPWKEDAIEHGRVRSQVEALALEALAHHAGSDPSQARGVLSEALSLGQAKGFRGLFLDEGARMAALLQEALPALPRNLRLFATTLLHSFPAEATTGRAVSDSEVQVEVLSQQETRVLRLLVAGLSNAEIAQELVVSTNTVKTQVKSIYRKLNVNSRDEARQLARELKLV